jgi:pseudouridylate synthase
MNVIYSSEVMAARRKGVPLVALESSVVAQGLPAPHNLQAARRCEDAVREVGAAPATIGVIDGDLCVGLEPAQLERLAKEKNLLKVASRDLAVAVANRRTGGTTVSATCEIATAAGIAVFATGGLGGVHREVSSHWDISQDLHALTRWPVAVVCAGAKSVLDLPKTLEVLETLSVPVIGVGTDELPGFYSRSTGLPLEHSVPNAERAAEVMLARRDLKQGGILFAVPPPAKTALPQATVERHLKAALAVAKKKRVNGKAVTPFLLSELSARTKGQSLKANLALLENNARFAGQLAVALGWR